MNIYLLEDIPVHTPQQNEENILENKNIAIYSDMHGFVFHLLHIYRTNTNTATRLLKNI